MKTALLHERVFKLDRFSISNTILLWIAKESLLLNIRWCRLSPIQHYSLHASDSYHMSKTLCNCIRETFQKDWNSYSLLLPFIHPVCDNRTHNTVHFAHAPSCFLYVTTVILCWAQLKHRRPILSLNAFCWKTEAAAAALLTCYIHYTSCADSGCKQNVLGHIWFLSMRHLKWQVLMESWVSSV